jgi:hypothetical protein
MIRDESRPNCSPALPDTILCLANSYKHGNRCVAGISISTKKWVRLVGRRVPGCLTREESCYRDGTEVAILDVFETELGEECGSNCHPEDVYTTEKPWHLIRRFDEPQDARTFSSYVSQRPVILQGYGNRVTAHRVEETPMSRSLELIHPEDLWWWIREENGKRKNRAVLRVSYASRIRYDFSVTDPVWLDKLHSLPLGIYPHAHFFKEKPPRTFLTMSLSEPFEGFLYKLVAGVVCLPA